jgi:hypothetical protein
VVSEEVYSSYKPEIIVELRNEEEKDMEGNI